MKTETRTTEIYVANDGTEFDDMLACLRHEMNAKAANRVSQYIAEHASNTVKTEKGQMRLRNILMDYEAFIVMSEAQGELELPDGNEEVVVEYPKDTEAKTG